MLYYIYDGGFYNSDELIHYGIKGMKWGVRRYQNKDGSLTEAGKKRLYKQTKRVYEHGDSEHEHLRMQYNKLIRGMHKSLKDSRVAYEKADYLSKDFQNDPSTKRKYLTKAYERYFKKYDLLDDDNAIRKAAETEASSGEDIFDSFRDSAFRLYIKDKGIDPNAYQKKVRNAYNDYIRECKRYVNTQLGEMGNMPVKDYGYYQEKYNHAVTNALVRSADWDWQMSGHIGYQYDQYDPD